MGSTSEVPLPEFVALPEDMLDVARSGKQECMRPGARECRPVLSRFAAKVSIAVCTCLPAMGRSGRGRLAYAQGILMALGKERRPRGHHYWHGPTQRE